MNDNNVLLSNFPRMERDQRIAVLYSPGYGAGWATWNDKELTPILTTHRDIVQCVLDGDHLKAAKVATELAREALGKPDAYICVGGAETLEIEWITKGSQFEFEEYDGSERIHIIGSRKYQTV